MYKIWNWSGDLRPTDWQREFQANTRSNRTAWMAEAVTGAPPRRRGRDNTATSARRGGHGEAAVWVHTKGQWQWALFRLLVRSAEVTEMMCLQTANLLKKMRLQLEWCATSTENTPVLQCHHWFDRDGNRFPWWCSNTIRIRKDLGNGVHKLLSLFMRIEVHVQFSVKIQSERAAREAIMSKFHLYHHHENCWCKRLASEHVKSHCYMTLPQGEVNVWTMVVIPVFFTN
jgi:hypothetical protein